MHRANDLFGTLLLPHELHTLLGVLLDRHGRAVWHVVQAIVRSIIQGLADLVLPCIVRDLVMSLRITHGFPNERTSESAIGAVSTLATNCRGTGHQSTPFTSNPIFIFMRPVQDRQTTKSGTKTEVVIGIVEFQEFASLGLSHPLPKSTYRRCPNIRLLLVIPDKGLVVDGVIGHIVFSEFRVSSRGAGREQEAAADGWAWRMTEGDGGLLGLIGAYWGLLGVIGDNGYVRMGKC